MASINYTYTDGLESQRLITRFMTAEDAVPWIEFFKDEEAMLFFPNLNDMTPEKRSAAWMERLLTRYKEKRYGFQALIEKKSGAFIGQSGLLKQEVDGKEELEVGYHLLKPYRGRGYATEAARLFIDYAFVNRLATSVISIIDRRNANSIRVAERNDLYRDKETTWQGFDVVIYRINIEKE